MEPAHSYRRLGSVNVRLDSGVLRWLACATRCSSQSRSWRSPEWATSAAADAPAGRAHALFFDALSTDRQTTGPGPTHVGHREIASGILRDATGRQIGSFTFTCTWTRISPDGALERCAGSASTADGRLDAAGPAHSNSVTHTWRITGGTGLYRDAAGTVGLRDLGDRESLVSATVTTLNSGTLRDGKVSRPVANDAFIARDQRPLPTCRPSSSKPSAVSVQRLRSASSEPVATAGNRRVLHRARRSPPDPRRAPEGAAGPRASARRTRQVARTLTGRERELAIIDEQDRAAAASDVRAFVRTVRDSAANFREIAITATVFGSTRCVL